jgi:hypothetical protein
MGKQWLHIICALAILGLADPIFAAEIGKGNILFEWFDGTRSTTSLAEITDGRSWRYPDYPTVSQWRTSFDGIDGRGDYYVTRVRGYVYPPADGDYTFWITSDDQSQLWLSTDENPANMVMISQVTGYSGATEWTKFPEQKSAAITLKAGKKYYIEALHREGSGGDRLRVAWGGPTIGAGPVIIAGTYLSPFIRPVDLKASNPSPVNGELGQMIPLMSWTKGVTATWHKLYFGTEPNLPFVTQLPAAMATSTYVLPLMLEAGTTYYWRVDEVESDGTTVYTGDVWSFRAPPERAWGPTPPNDARGVFTDVTLAWRTGKSAFMHDVYFGENEADVTAGTGDTFQVTTPVAAFSPVGMKTDTTYYWRVDEIDMTNNKIPGPVWKFTTLPPRVVTDPNLIGWWKLDEVMGIAVDYSGHGYHGTINSGVNGGGLSVTGMAGGAIEFDGMDDTIDIGKNAVDLGIDGAKPKSVSVWVYTHNFKNGGIFETGARVASQNFSLRTRGGNNQWRVQYYSVDQDFTYTSLDTWVHFALVYDGTTSTCYANNTVVASAARTLDTAATLMFQIGVYNNYRFDGAIDDFRLYNKALTPEEVQYLYERTDPRQAWDPTPTVGRVDDAPHLVPLAWQPGDGAVHHDVYLGTDSTVVQNADVSDATGVYRGRIGANSYMPDPALDWNDTYYWRVDEVMPSGETVKGQLWNFSVLDWLIIEDFESYTNDSPNRMFQTWLDGYGYSADDFVKAYAGNGTGSGVGHDIWSVDSAYYNGSIAETGLRHGGAQSMPLYYTNSGSPYYAETERTWTQAQDWTIEDVNALILHIRGNPRRFVKTSESSFSLSGAGTDIWGTSDQFRFAFKMLTGDGTIIARVTDNGFGTNRWAKGGVMIRASNDPATVNAFTAVTGGDGDGGTFQWRPTDAASSVSSRTLIGIAPPYWVRLDRQGNTFTGYLSADGQNWLQEGTSSIDIAMTDPVLIGVAVTSHAANQVREFEFDNITITGKVTGAWTVEDIGVVQRSNEDAMPLYVMVQDWNNRSAVVVHPDANILLSEDWSEWKIPLTAFTNVTMQAVKKMSIGVGDRKKPQAGGDGLIYIDDIGLSRPAAVTP